eukprot:5491186-Lingulodinium_polyedra.AAC.1
MKDTAVRQFRRVGFQVHEEVGASGFWGSEGRRPRRHRVGQARSGGKGRGCVPCPQPAPVGLWPAVREG